MFTFIIAISTLVVGYLVYGKFIAKFFGEDPNKETPAYKINDGVDYIPMPRWKVFTIEFLNIAGLGPIFGAILGAMYGPWAYLWIVVGCIFMGSVHDYFSGMLSVRNDGASLPELVGKYLGTGMQQFLRLFTISVTYFCRGCVCDWPGWFAKYSHRRW
jgi:carbon starvation protein CstA